MGQSPTADHVSTLEAGLPFLQGCAEFGSRYPVPEFYCNPPLRVSKAESILISVRAPVGTTNWADQAYCIGRGLAAVKANEYGVNTKYVAYAIAQYISFLHRRSQGSTFLAISASDLKDFPIPSASPEEQDLVVQILQSIDQTIEKTEALIKKYQQIKAGLMHDLFTRGIGDDGKLRPPRDQAPELYQKTAIGWIPKDWTFCTCRDVCQKIIDCKNRTPPITLDGHPVIRTPNVRNGQFVDTDLVYTDAHSYRIWTARGKPKPGDVVITREAPVGEVCKIPSRHEHACLGQRMMLYRTDRGKVNNDFFLYALQSTVIQSRLDLISGGSTVGHVRVGDIRDLWFFHPTDSTEQELIAKALNRVSEKLEIEVRVLSKLNKKKLGLMHDLLTGKVEVSDDLAETATH